MIHFIEPSVKQEKIINHKAVIYIDTLERYSPRTQKNTWAETVMQNHPRRAWLMINIHGENELLNGTWSAGNY